MRYWITTIYTSCMFFFDCFVTFAVTISFYRVLIPIDGMTSGNSFSYQYSHTLQFLSALIFLRLMVVMFEHISDRYIAPIIRHAHKRKPDE